MTADGIDIRHLPYMPLEIERLKKSRTWLRCKRRPELAFYLMNLWMRAWHEVPAGSIENDDDVLADAAMCDPSLWADIKSEVMSDWEDRDGRVFHSVVEELVLEAVEKLRGNQKRTAKAREAAAAKREQESNSSVTDSATDDEGKGREGKTSISKEIDEAPPSGKDKVARETPATILRQVLDAKRADALVKHRIKKKSPLTDHIAQLLVDKLSRFADPNRAADVIMEKGWTSIETDWAGVPPLKPTTPDKPMVWVTIDDPRWDRLADRWAVENQKPKPRGYSSQHGDGRRGWHFAPEWIAELKAQENAA